MTRLALLCSILVAGSASAQGTPSPAQPKPGAMDMTKMGPWTRKPTNEAKTKKELTEFLRKEEELAKAKNFDALTARIDFPVYMATDDSKGVPTAKEYTREQYVQMMKPFYEGAPEMTVKYNPTFTLLSDSLATMVADFTMTSGKQKLTGRTSGLLVLRNGEWKWKTMVEAGWGGMEAGTGGSPPQK